MPTATNFVDTRLPGLVHQLDAHHAGCHRRTRPGGPVGADAADVRRQVEHDIRPGVSQQSLDGLAIRQIVVLAARHGDIPCPQGRQPIHDVRAQEPGAAGNQHPPLAPVLVRLSELLHAHVQTISGIGPLISSLRANAGKCPCRRSAGSGRRPPIRARRPPSRTPGRSGDRRRRCPRGPGR